VNKKLACLLVLALAPISAFAHPPDAGTVETVVQFSSAQLETPESIAIDVEGNLYVSLAITGEIRKIAPDGTQSTLALLPIGPILTFCGPFFNAVTGITLDNHGNLYASLVSCEEENRGIWRISTEDGSAEILGTVPLAGLPNGIAVRHGYVYAADTSLGVIWRVPVEGSATGEAELWLSDPLLEGDFSQVPPLGGANGLQIFRQTMYVANSGFGWIVAIPFEPHDAPGEPSIHATLPSGLGCDDFAFDVHGSIYCTTNVTNFLIRIDPDGTSEVLLTGADGLDGPTAAIFGRTGADRFNLYITNGAFPFGPNNQSPSVMRLHLGVVGEP
jgi:sugar lactone lactonase YvrE